MLHAYRLQVHAIDAPYLRQNQNFPKFAFIMHPRRCAISRRIELAAMVKLVVSWKAREFRARFSLAAVPPSIPR